MGRRMAAVLVAAGLSVHAADAGAQVIQRPPRVYRGLFGAGTAAANHWQHKVTFVTNTLGGYDTNMNPVAGDGAVSGGNTPGFRGAMAFVGAQLSYSFSRAASIVEVDVRGFGNGFRGIELDPVYGGEGSARVALPLGGRTSITGYERYSDTPLFAPTVTGPSTPIDGPFVPSDVPLAGMTTNYLPRRSATLDGNLALERRLSRRSRLAIGGLHGSTRFADHVGDSDLFGGLASYSLPLGHRSSMMLGYNYTNTRTEAGAGVVRPYENHLVDLGYGTSVRLSPERQFAFSIGGGMTRVFTESSVTAEPLSYSTPSGHANVRLDLTRSWNIAVDYGRGVSVVEGVSLDTFLTEHVGLRAGGRLGSRADLAFSADWDTGQAGGDGSGTYDSYTGVAQAQFEFGSMASGIVSYTFYAYRLVGATTITESMPTDLDRHAVRAGIVLRLPLYGRTVGRQGGTDAAR